MCYMKGITFTLMNNSCGPVLCTFTYPLHFLSSFHNVAGYSFFPLIFLACWISCSALILMGLFPFFFRRQQYLGDVVFARFDQCAGQGTCKRILLGTKENVIGAVNTRTGDIGTINKVRFYISYSMQQMLQQK